jgi:hypothetical protein
LVARLKAIAGYPVAGLIALFKIACLSSQVLVWVGSAELFIPDEAVLSHGPMN